MIRNKTSLSCLLWVMLAACSKPENDPGVCSLDCSNAVFGGNDFTFESIYKVDTFACPRTDYGSTGILRVDVPITLQFKSVKKSVVNGKEREVPKGNLSFQPIVGGYLDPQATDAGNESDSGQYNGISTPKSEWCTDSCGVASVTVNPVCVKGSDNSVSVMLRSGALYSDLVKFVFTKPEDVTTTPTPTPSPTPAPATLTDDEDQGE